MESQGITTIATPGHTPGHTSVQIASGSDHLLCTADVVANRAVGFQRPDWRGEDAASVPGTVYERKGVSLDLPPAVSGSRPCHESRWGFRLDSCRLAMEWRKSKV